MNKEITKLRKELKELKEKRDFLIEKSKLKQEIKSIHFKKGFNVFAQFNPFRDVELKENFKEIWNPIRTYFVGMKREQLRQERREDWLLAHEFN